MPELQDDIVTEDFDFQQEPEPKLPDSHRKKLDSIVVQLYQKGATKEEIVAVVNDYKSKYATKPLVIPAKQQKTEGDKFVKFDTPRLPTKEEEAGMSHDNIVAPSIEKPKESYAIERQQRKRNAVNSSQEKLLTELQGNDDVIEKMIRQQRFDTDAQNRLAPTSEMQNTGMREFSEPQTKPQDLPVTPEDMQSVKMDIEQDQHAARRVLLEVTKQKPEKRREIESSVYWLDADNSVKNDPNADERLKKIEQNAKGIEKGELIYNVQNGKLIKPQGVVGSFVTGWKAKSQLFDDYSFFNDKTDDEVIAELEKRRTEYDPDEPIPVPKHTLGEAGQMVGSMPVKSMIAGTAVSAVGAPEAAPFAAAGIGALDFYKMGYAGTLQNVYYQLREEGKSEAEALQMARTQAKKEAAIDAAMGGAMSFVGARFGVKPLNFSVGYKASIGTFLKGAGKDGAMQGLIGAGGEIAKNKLAQAAGIKRDTDANVLEAIEGNFMFTVGMAAAAKLGRGLSSIKYRSILNGLKNVDGKLVDANINTELQAGRITDQQAENIRTEIKNYKELDSQIPENVTEEARLDIQNKLEKRNELEQKLEGLNKAFHPAIKEQIKVLDEEINTLAENKVKKERLPDEVKELKKLVDDELDEGVVQGYMGDALKQAAPEDLPKIMKEISEQANDPQIADMTRATFGDAIVDKAIEMFPIEEKKSSISVIRPEEIKQHETVTIQPKEEPVAETVPTEESIPPITPQPEPEMTGITHQQMDETAKEFGLQTYQEAPETVELWDKQADERIAKDPEAIGTLLNKMRNGVQPDAVEQRMIIKYVADLKAKIRINPTDELLNEFKRVRDLSNIVGGRDVAKSLRARQGEVPVIESEADMMTAKMDANAKETLTPEEKAKVSGQFDKIDAAKKSLAEKGKGIADRIRALRPKTDSAQSQFFGLPVAIYDTALVAIAEAVEQGAKLADAIQHGIKYIKQNGGFKDKKEEKNFAAFVKGEITYDERLEAFKKRTKAATDNLKDKTKEGDFEPNVRPILELDEEARKIRSEYRKAKYEFELELQKDKLRQRPFLQKAIDVLLEPLRTVRTLMTTLDLSAVLRQGVIPTIAHPTLAAKAFPEMLRQTISKGRFDEWLADLKDSPLYDVMEKSKLYISDPNSLHLSAKEENFMSNLAEKIPVVGHIVKGSERAYVSYLNKMRADLFKQGVEVFMSDGKTIQNSQELYEGLANFINNSTGRGKLGPLEGSADFLNTVFFSPRLMASRINMLGLTDVFTAGQKGFYSQLPKEVRVMAIKDMLKFIGFGVSVLGLSRLGGAEVEQDPRSTDFGKMKFGNTRYDIWGGFQPYVRLIAQVASGQTKSTTSGQTKELNPKGRFDRVTSFLRGKLAPVPGSAVDLMAGENIIGEPSTLQSEALESITPMIISDVREAMKDQGVKALFTIGIPSAFGVSTSTYGPDDNKTGTTRKRENRPSRPKRANSRN